MAVNMFNKPVEGRFINTYAKLPFQEIAAMGDQLQKASDKSLDAVDALGEMTYIDTMESDDPRYQEQVKGFNEKIDEIQNLHLSDPMKANYLSRQLGREIGKWRNFGAGKYMADNYASYQSNMQDLDKMYQTGLIDADDLRKRKALAKSRYQGIGEGDVYNRYQSYQPAFIKETLQDQANKLGTGIKENALLGDLEPVAGGQFIDRKTKEIVSGDRVRNIISSGLNTPQNLAYVKEQAEMKAMDLFGDKNVIDVNGQPLTRDKFVELEANRMIDDAVTFGVNKFAYEKNKGQLVTNQAWQNAYKSSLAAKELADNFTIVSKSFENINKENFDDLSNRSTELRSKVSESEQNLRDHRLKIATQNNLKTEEEIDNFLKDDKEYQDAIINLRDAKLKVEASEAVTQPLVSDAIKRLDEKLSKDAKGLESGILNFKKDKKAEKYASGIIDKLTDSRLGMISFIKPSLLGEKITPEKLGNHLQNAAEQGVDFYQALDQFGIDTDKVKKLIGNTFSVANWGDEDSREFNQTFNVYEKMFNGYKNKIKEQASEILEEIKDNNPYVSNFNVITGYDKTKEGSSILKVINSFEESINDMGGEGLSGLDGRSLEAILKDEGLLEQDAFGLFPDKDFKGWEMKYHLTDGISSSGNPIGYISITDDEGRRKNIAVERTVGGTGDILRAAREMINSSSPDVKKSAQNILLNFTRIDDGSGKAPVPIGKVAKDAKLHTLFDKDTPTNRVNSLSTLRSKQDGKMKQLYIRGNKEKAKLGKFYEVVYKDGDSYKKAKLPSGSDFPLFAGEDELKRFLYNASQGK